MGYNEKTKDMACATLELLRYFNRKERYHLLCDAVTGSDFSLSKQFTTKLHVALNKNRDTKDEICIPGDAYTAMDYHLDWIAAAVSLAAKSGPSAVKEVESAPSSKQENPQTVYASDIRNGERSPVITGNQQDTDLLVAFVNGAQLHLILVEAKVESGWNGAQIREKGQRLKDIFGDDGNAFDFVKVWFVLAGPGADHKAPGFGTDTLEELPSFFFKNRTAMAENFESRDAENLYRINLTAAHSLYQPTRRTKGKDSEWVVIRSYSVDRFQEAK